MKRLWTKFVDDAKKRLWAEGYLVGTISEHGCPVRPVYQDANGKSFFGKERKSRKLAALHTDGLEVVEIQLFAENQ